MTIVDDKTEQLASLLAKLYEAHKGCSTTQQMININDGNREKEKA